MNINAQGTSYKQTKMKFKKHSKIQNYKRL